MLNFKKVLTFFGVLIIIFCPYRTAGIKIYNKYSLRLPLLSKSTIIADRFKEVSYSQITEMLGQVIRAESDKDLEFYGKAKANLLANGKILLNQALHDKFISKNPEHKLEAMQAIVHEIAECMLQVLKHEDVSIYNAIKDRALIGLVRFYKGFAGDLPDDYRGEVLANHIWATILEHRLMGIDPENVKDNTLKLLLEEGYKIIDTDRSFFKREFSELHYAKETALRGVNKGMRFDRAATSMTRGKFFKTLGGAGATVMLNEADAALTSALSGSAQPQKQALTAQEIMSRVYITEESEGRLKEIISGAGVPQTELYIKLTKKLISLGCLYSSKNEKKEGEERLQELIREYHKLLIDTSIDFNSFNESIKSNDRKKIQRALYKLMDKLSEKGYVSSYQPKRLMVLTIETFYPGFFAFIEDNFPSNVVAEVKKDLISCAAVTQIVDVLLGLTENPELETRTAITNLPHACLLVGIKGLQSFLLVDAAYGKVLEINIPDDYVDAIESNRPVAITDQRYLVFKKRVKRGDIELMSRLYRERNDKTIMSSHRDVVLSFFFFYLRPSNRFAMTPIILNNIASWLLRLDKYYESLELYKDAMEFDRGYAEVHFNYANLVLILRTVRRDSSITFDRVISEYQRAIEFNPFCSRAHLSIGIMLVDPLVGKNEYEDAIRHWEKWAHFVINDAEFRTELPGLLKLLPETMRSRAKELLNNAYQKNWNIGGTKQGRIGLRNIEDTLKASPLLCGSI